MEGDKVVDINSKKAEPLLTVDQFYEKTLKLNEVYVNNIKNVQDQFYKKQSALFERLSKDDQEVVRNIEREKMNKVASQIVTQGQGLVDARGNKITTH